MTPVPKGEVKNSPPVPYALRNETFASALLDPDTEIPKGVGKKQDGSDIAKPAESLKRFSVYRNNVVVSLMEAMRAAYPSIARIMGEDNFSRVARNFILAHPPKSPMMQQYGEAFPAFVENFKPLKNSPFLKDVATAEQAWLKAFHALDEDVLTAEALQSADADAVMDLVFEPHPAFHLIQSDFPVFDLFNARVLWPKPDFDIKDSQSLIITRPAFECFAYQIDTPTAVFFSKLSKGISLGQAITEMNEKYAKFDAAGAISTLLQTGIFKQLTSIKKS